MKLTEINMSLTRIINYSNANVCNRVDYILQKWGKNQNGGLVINRKTTRESLKRLQQDDQFVIDCNQNYQNSVSQKV